MKEVIKMEEKENLVVEEKVEEAPVEEVEALEPVGEESLDDLSLELEGVEEATSLEEAEIEDPLVSEDQGKYADGFPDWNLEPPMGK